MRIGPLARPEIDVDGIVWNDACKRSFDPRDLVAGFAQPVLHMRGDQKAVLSLLYLPMKCIVFMNLE